MSTMTNVSCVPRRVFPPKRKPSVAPSRMSIMSSPSMTAVSESTVCLLENSPPILRASEEELCVHEKRLSMTANSDLTVCLTEQRPSLSASSQKTVTCFQETSSVHATDMHSEATMCFGRPSMSASSEKTIFITETIPDYHNTRALSAITVCLNGSRMSLSASSDVTVCQKRPSLSCNSDCTVNVRKPSLSCNSDATVGLDSQRVSLSCNSDCTVNVHQPRMRCNSNKTVCLGSLRESLTCNSDCTVNVCQPRMRCNSNKTVCLGSVRNSLSCNSDCTVNVRQPSLGCNSDATVYMPQLWADLRKFSDGYSCYDERLSVRSCESFNFSENKDLSDQQVGIIDKILLNVSPDGYAGNSKRTSHMAGSGTLSHRRKTYCPSSLVKDHSVRSNAHGHRQRFASVQSMSPNLAREMAMRLYATEVAKGWTFADLFTMRNAFRMSPLIILLAILLPYIHVDMHQCPLEDECFHCTFHFGEDSGENEIAELQKDWWC